MAAIPNEELNRWQQQFLHRLERRGYRERRRYFWRMSARFPRFFYKYVSIDQANPTSVDQLRDLVVRSRFWLSAPVDFNDPFDFKITTTVEGTAAERRRRWKNILG